MDMMRKARRASVALFVPAECKEAMDAAKNHYLIRNRERRERVKKLEAEAAWADQYNAKVRKKREMKERRRRIEEMRAEEVEVGNNRNWKPGKFWMNGGRDP